MFLGDLRVHSVPSISVRPLLVLLAALAPCLPVAAVESLHSPDDAVAVSVDLVGQQLRWSIAYHGQPVIDQGVLGLTTDRAPGVGYQLTSVARSAGDSTWKPLAGPRSEIPDRYRELTLTVTSTDPKPLTVEVILRAYAEGVACRYRIPAQNGGDQITVTGRQTAFRFTADHTVYQNRNYSYGSTRIGGMLRSEGNVTLALAGGAFASLTDADRADFSQVMWNRHKTEANTVVGSITPARGKLPFATSWEVLMLGRNAADLHHNRMLVPTLNPPCAIADPSWIRPGKAITQVYNARMTTAELKPLLAFASQHGFEYVEIDHSWSGAETKWTAAEIANFEQKMGPFWKAHPEWRQHVGGSPLVPAKGYVPFRPTSYDGGNLVDLDLPALVAYGNSLTPKVGICLYVRCSVLKEFGGDHAIDDVFRTYAQWGIAGVKPGFVPSATQEHERAIAYMVRNAAEHRLIAVIHDGLVPHGLCRTYPNLLNIEGVAGEEGEPSIPAAMKSLHDIMIPFTRGLMGPLDYTPQFYKKSKTQCHQVAMIGIYDGRHSLRAGMKAWSPGGEGGSEIGFISRYPALCDDERTFADLGRYIAVARRKGDTWFVAAMSGTEAVTTTLPLDFLTPGKRYRATFHRDTPGSLKATAGTAEVAAGSTWSLAMEANGGQVLILDPLP